ncbi:LPS translocon maturation chaperone LptM [Polycladidibacter hongkongensis]|uniref:LPS translocon maturation chaperone LptM n=1 Tax=Polycladidibacter hongkongensis TaxID=1647556 RepID=UPI000830AAE2|nr:lipoprotein [Pseudovibrio hongkongensis]
MGVYQAVTGKRFLTPALVLGVVLMLAACGRKGALQYEPSPLAAPEQLQEQPLPEAEDEQLQEALPDSEEVNKDIAGKSKPAKSSFPLDFLI